MNVALGSGSPITRHIRIAIQIILDSGISGHDVPERIVERLGGIKIIDPLRHIHINTVLGQYFCETIVMIPVLEQCSMSNNSNFIIFAQDLMQDHAKVKMEVNLEGTHNGEY